MKKFILISAVALLLTACGDGGVSDFAKAEKFMKAEDFENALTWSVKAANQGHGKGTVMAGVLYGRLGVLNYSDSKIKLGMTYFCKALDGDLEEDVRKIVRNALLLNNYTCN